MRRERHLSHLLVGAGKEGTIYLVNRDNLGHYNTGSSDSQIVQYITGAIGGGGSYATPAYFNYRIYYTGKTDNVRAFTITNALISSTPQSISPTTLGAFTGSPVVSANGTSNAIVWVTDPGPTPAAARRCCTRTTPPTWRYNCTTPARTSPGTIPAAR